MRVIVIFRDMRNTCILVERSIASHYEYAIKLCMHRLEMCTQGPWNWLLFHVKQLYFFRLKFDIELTFFRHSVNELFSVK